MISQEEMDKVIARLKAIAVLVKELKDNTVDGVMPQSFYDALTDIEMLLTGVPIPRPTVSRRLQ